MSSAYFPHTEGDIRKMMERAGITSPDGLYADVPEALLLDRPLKLPDGMSEMSVRRLFAALVQQNNTALSIFRGAGAYNHYIPAAVPQLASRSEFYTAYTPYQAEISQGILQSIFEYQTMICELTGMDVSNASVYDGATAAAEAITMCVDRRRRRAPPCRGCRSPAGPVPGPARRRHCGRRSAGPHPP